MRLSDNTVKHGISTCIFPISLVIFLRQMYSGGWEMLNIILIHKLQESFITIHIF